MGAPSGPRPGGGRWGGARSPGRGGAGARRRWSLWGAAAAPKAPAGSNEPPARTGDPRARRLFMGFSRRCLPCLRSLLGLESRPGFRQRVPPARPLPGALYRSPPLRGRGSEWGLREVEASPGPAAPSRLGLGRCEVREASGRRFWAMVLTTQSGSGSCRGKGPREQRGSSLFTRFVAWPVPQCVCGSSPGCTKEQPAGFGPSCGRERDG